MTTLFIVAFFSSKSMGCLFASFNVFQAILSTAAQTNKGFINDATRTFRCTNNIRFDFDFLQYIYRFVCVQITMVYLCDVCHLFVCNVFVRVLVSVIVIQILY